MVAVAEAPADFRQAAHGQHLGEIHGDLPRSHHARGAAMGNQVQPCHVAARGDDGLDGLDVDADRGVGDEEVADHRLQIRLMRGRLPALDEAPDHAAQAARAPSRSLGDDVADGRCQRRQPFLGGEQVEEVAALLQTRLAQADARHLREPRLRRIIAQVAERAWDRHHQRRPAINGKKPKKRGEGGGHGRSFDGAQIVDGDEMQPPHLGRQRIGRRRAERGREIRPMDRRRRAPPCADRVNAGLRQMGLAATASAGDDQAPHACLLDIEQGARHANGIGVGRADTDPLEDVVRGERKGRA